MRYWYDIRNKTNPGFAQAQKREEREMFRCYYEAIACAKMPGQQTNLDLVRRYLIEGDGDLYIDVFENFLNVCVELEGVNAIPLLDVLKFHPEHPGKGHGYKIPSRTKNLVGHLKAVEMRKAWRARFRAEYGPEGSQARDIIERITRPKLSVIQGGVR